MSLLARRVSRHGLQAVVIAAERLQLTVSPSVCSQLQQTSPVGQQAGSAGPSWQALTPWQTTHCTSQGGLAQQSLVRWHSSKPASPDADIKTSRGQDGIWQAFSKAGWTRREVLNVPNGLSLLRLLSGPVIASWILQGQWHLALPSLAVSGATDWADGYVAKNYDQRSVLGSYLDPLADKTLMCSVIAALGYTGVLSAPMVALILGRDVFLVVGAFAARAESLGWRWPGAGEFFRLQPVSSGSAAPSSMAAAGQHPATAEQEGAQQPHRGDSQSASSGSAGAQADDKAAEAPAAPFVEPLYISKVNTCFQLVLVGACMSRAWLGVPSEDVVWWLAASTAGTTMWSCAAYVTAFRAGRLLTAGKQG